MDHGKSRLPAFLVDQGAGVIIDYSGFRGFCNSLRTLQCLTQFGSLLGVQRHISMSRIRSLQAQLEGHCHPRTLVLEAAMPIRFVVHLSRAIDSYVRVRGLDWLEVGPSTSRERVP